MEQAGKLYIVPTPIGNLSDMTFRAVECLKEANVIYCEDTRVSGKLLKHFDIDKPLRSLHQHNEQAKIPGILEEIIRGEKVAYISDAGTPAISDPGFLLVRAAREAQINVEALPGASAFVTALSAAGVPCHRFVFEGFLPQKKGRQKRLEEMIESELTSVFYESPHRLLKVLTFFKDKLSLDRKVVVARELTKMHEEYIIGNIEEVFKEVESRAKIKGEIVIIVEGNK